jgi:MFS family permease
MFTGKKKRILAAVSLHHACNDASVVTLPTIFPLLYTQGDIIRSYSDIGTVILIGLITAVVFQALMGHIVKTRHSRYYLALDALLVGISLLLITKAANFWMFVVFFLGVRIGTSIYHPVGISWVSHSFADEDLDRAMGFQSAFGNIGVLAAFLSTGIIAERFGWKAPLYIWGGINLAASALGLALSHGTIDDDEVVKQRQIEKEPVSWRRAFLGLVSFIPMMIVGGLAWGITVNYAPSLLNHRLGVPISITGVIMGCWMLFGTISAFFYGKISGKLGRPRTLVYAYTLVALIAFTFAFSRNIPLTFTLFGLYGVALFLTYPANLSFIGGSVDKRNSTAAFALGANIMIIGNSIFSYVSGKISDNFGIHSPFILLGSMSVLVVTYLFVMIRTGRISAPGRIVARSDHP